MSTFEEIIAKEGHLLYTNVGNSMMPLLRQGRDLMVIGRKPQGRLKRYDIPLYKRDNGQYILHRILKARKDDYVLCGDNQWHRETGITDRHIIGVLLSVVRDGKQIPVTDWRFRLYSHLWCDFYGLRATLFWLRDLPKRIRRKIRQLELPAMTASESALFFQLIREGLWEETVSEILEGVRWQVLLTQFKYQTIMGVVAGPLMRLVKQKLLSPTVTREISQRIGLNMQRHHELNQEVISVFQLLSQGGFHPILLKGQGNAQFYPVPVARQCGDIDVFIGRDDYKKAITYVNRHLGGKEGEQVGKHYHLDFRNSHLELHREAEVQHLWGTNRYFQELTQHYLRKTPPDHVLLNGTPIPVPPLQFNVLYVFNHLWHHFVTTGVGLRQCCDWAMLLHKAHGRIDIALLQEQLTRLHLMRQWQYVGWLLVNRLGLPKEEMPFYTDTAQTKAEKIWLFMEREGNFGKHRKGTLVLHLNKWIRKPLSLARGVHRATKMCAVSWTDALCKTSSLLVRGICGLFN